MGFHNLDSERLVPGKEKQSFYIYHFRLLHKNNRLLGTKYSRSLLNFALIN